MGILIFTLLSLIIIIILSQNIDIRLFEFEGKPKIKIGFTIFALEISEFEKRRKKKPLRERIRGAIFLATFLKELVLRSSVNVKSQNISRDGLLSPTRLVLFSILLPILQGYLSKNAFSYKEDEGGGTLDVIFSFNIYSVFISFFLALYYYIKTSIMRRANA